MTKDYKISKLHQLLSGHKSAVFAVIVSLTWLYLLPVALVGIDVCDTGFYLTFYQNIFSSPQSVEYNFMYYFSGVIGGLIDKVFPSIGLLGWKIAGLVTLTLAQWAAYRMLRNTLKIEAIVVGNLLMVFSFVGLPIALCNDLLTTLFYGLALCLLYHGINLKHRWLLFASGVIIGINVFVRVPNVLACVLIFTPFLFNDGRRIAARLAGFVSVGVIVGAGLILMLMNCLGHYGLFISNMSDLFVIAGDATGGSTHSIGNMIMEYLKFYFKESGVLLLLLVIVLVYDRRKKTRNFSLPLAILCCLAVLALSMIYNTLEVVWAICVLGGIMVYRGSNDKRVRLAVVLGWLMMLIFPLGSDGAYNNGSIIALVAAPVAAQSFIPRRRWVLLLPFFVVCSYQMMLTGAYFDGGALWKKTARVEHSRLSFVTTTPSRAEVLNDMLAVLPDHVAKGDTLMVYGSMPMINYLTGTRPAMGCSWPELLSAPLLEYKMTKQQVAPRWILRQHFNTLSKDWGEPVEYWETRYYPGYSPFLDNRKLDVLNNYINSNGYRIEFENKYFTLYRLENN